MQVAHTRKTESGYTLMELLVSLGLSSVVLLTVISQYSLSVRLSHDHNIRIATMLEAQAVLQTIGSEVRMMGNGVPFDQANFQIGESTLSDPSVTQPIILNGATSSSISFRLNESGDTHLLTTDFDPSAGLVLSLTDTTNLTVNDPIYLSNSVVSGDDGLFGTVAAVNHSAHTVTLAAGYVVSPGATFDMGSVLEEVPIVTYNSPIDGSGVTRDSGFGPVLMGHNTVMSLEYLSANGSAVPLPLTEVTVVDSLRAVRVTIQKNSAKTLSNGQPYSVSVSQTFGVRNLNYLY